MAPSCRMEASRGASTPRSRACARRPPPPRPRPGGAGGIGGGVPSPRYRLRRAPAAGGGGDGPMRWGGRRDDGDEERRAGGAEGEASPSGQQREGGTGWRNFAAGVGCAAALWAFSTGAAATTTTISRAAVSAEPAGAAETDASLRSAPPGESSSAGRTTSSAIEKASKPQKQQQLRRSDQAAGGWVWSGFSSIETPALQQFLYELDCYLESNPFTFAFAQVGMTGAIVVLGGVAFFVNSRRLEDVKDTTWANAIWRSWGCICAASNHTKARHSSSRIIGLIMCIAGLMSYSLLTGTISATMRDVLKDFHVRTYPPNGGHVLVVGRNQHLLPLLEQINAAELLNSQRRGARRAVLLLTENSRSETERLVRPYADDLPALDLLFRSGPLNVPETYSSCGAHLAKSIVLLASHNDNYEADASAVLELVALQSGTQQGIRESKRALPKDWEPPHVVVQVSKASSGGLVRTLGASTGPTDRPTLRGGGDQALLPEPSTVPKSLSVDPVENVSAKLFAQCTRIPGIADVYKTLLSHHNDIINIRSYPTLAGLSYGELRKGIDDAVVVGLLRKDGKPVLHPDDWLPLRRSDKVLLIARKRTHMQPPPALEQAAAARRGGEAVPVTDEPELEEQWRPQQRTKAATKVPERLVLCGWRASVSDMAQELDNFAAPGSELVILSETPVAEREGVLKRRMTKQLRNLRVENVLGKPLSRRDQQRAILGDNLDASVGKRISVACIPEGEWYTDQGARADKQSLYAMLQAEDICTLAGVKLKSLVVELIDSSLGEPLVATKQRGTVECVGASELVALFTSQVVEHPELNSVWTELLSSYGSEIYIKDARAYATLGSETTFEELAERAHARGETAIGVRINGNVELNPVPKAAPFPLNAGDGVVVIADHGKE